MAQPSLEDEIRRLLGSEGEGTRSATFPGDGIPGAVFISPNIIDRQEVHVTKITVKDLRPHEQFNRSLVTLRCTVRGESDPVQLDCEVHWRQDEPIGPIVWRRVSQG